MFPASTDLAELASLLLTSVSHHLMMSRSLILHTIEHLCATFARNDIEWADRIVYFGPMGCRTGCYLLVEGERTSREMVPFMTKMFEFVRDFEGDIPGAKPEECGNYLDQNLPMAKYVARRYLENTLYNIDDAHLNYPA